MPGTSTESAAEYAGSPAYENLKIIEEQVNKKARSSELMQYRAALRSLKDYPFACLVGIYTEKRVEMFVTDLDNSVDIEIEFIKRSKPIYSVIIE